MSVKGTPDIGKVLAIIDSIYGAAADGRHWQEFLRDLAQSFSATGAQIVRVQPRDFRLNFSALYGYDAILKRVYGTNDLKLATQLFERHFAELMPTDPRMRFVEQFPSRPLSCRLQIAEAELHDSQIYRDMLHVADVEYSLVVSLAEDDGSLIVLGVSRGRHSSHFDHDDVATFSELIPHLKQAVAVSEHLSAVRFDADTAIGALDSLGMGIFLVDRDARLVHGNTAGMDVANQNDGMTLDAGQVRLSKPMDNEAFRRHLNNCFDNGDAGSIAMPVARPSGKKPIHMTIHRLNDLASPSAETESTAVLLFSLPETPLESRAELLRRLFGLTAAEAKLCELLAQGQNTHEAAASAGITVDTARTHLKKIFAKLDVSRQSQLIARITSSPAWLAMDTPRH